MGLQCLLLPFLTPSPVLLTVASEDPVPDTLGLPTDLLFLICFRLGDQIKPESSTFRLTVHQVLNIHYLI